MEKLINVLMAVGCVGLTATSLGIFVGMAAMPAFGNSDNALVLWCAKNMHWIFIFGVGSLVVVAVAGVLVETRE